MDASYRTPLGRVRGFGAARTGTGHFLSQRITALALLFLAPWFTITIAQAAREGFDGAQNYFLSPLNAVGGVLVIAVACLHMHAGVRVIIEDYLRKPVGKAALLLLNTFACVALAALGAFAILKISFGA